MFLLLRYIQLVLLKTAEKNIRAYSRADGLTRIMGIMSGRLKDIKDEGKAYVK